MFVVIRPLGRDHRVMDETWELRCHRCGKRFRSLTEAYLAYVPPEAGKSCEATWVHRKCGEGTTTDARPPRLLRADLGLYPLLKALLTPRVPLATRRTNGRMDWSEDEA